MVFRANCECARNNEVIEFFSDMRLGFSNPSDGAGSTGVRHVREDAMQVLPDVKWAWRQSLKAVCLEKAFHNVPKKQSGGGSFCPFWAPCWGLVGAGKILGPSKSFLSENLLGAWWRLCGMGTFSEKCDNYLGALGCAGTSWECSTTLYGRSLGMSGNVPDIFRACGREFHHQTLHISKPSQ
jgi:hypothetical protein